MHEELEQIVVQAQQGNQKALEEIFLRFRPFILKTCKRFYIKDYDMDDLIQIGNMSLLKALKLYKIKDKPCFTSYATSAIQNNYYMEIRTRAKTNYETSLDVQLEGGDSFLDLLPDVGEIDENLLREDQKMELLKAIDTLSPEEKELVQHVYFKGMTIKEYAKSIGVKYITCVKRKDTILNKLKKQLTQEK